MRTISFIGAGAVRVLGTIRGLADERGTLGGAEIRLMDPDARRLAAVAALARSMPEVRSAGMRVVDTPDLGRALDGADFVFQTIRIGGLDALLGDLRICRKHRLHGADDFGPSSVSISIRTIPAVLATARAMERFCPRAWLLNYTNPVPVMVEAIARTSKIRVLGLCGGDLNFAYDMADIMGWPSPCPDFEYDAAGINHFGWHLEPRFRGEPFYPMLAARLATADLSGLQYYHRWIADIFRVYGAVPFASGHCFHWLFHEEMLRRLPGEIRAARTRAAGAARSTARLEALAAGPTGDSWWDRDGLRGMTAGAVFNVAAAAILGLAAGSAKPLAVNTVNRGAVRNLPDDGIVEVSAVFEPDAVVPRRGLAVPEAIAGLTAAIVAHQKLLVSAVLAGDRRLLAQAVLADPSVRSLPAAESLAARILEANRPFAPWTS